ncbi:unnamed protein product [Microthlaspi erraticum]|uniref:FKB95-like N-terminal Kelch domain-containing protein n=1 Tax=Microthlaspi erraticum TaxID=1685480 RepID=A0A6D2L1D0_9BRAS|nr:unnamed protein product [Microthlaspi erraticum]
MKVRNEGVKNAWRKAPSMRAAREKAAVAGVLDERIYVMGGCKAEETANWAEVYDTKTQTWEALPDPGAELRSSLLKTIRMIKGKVYVENSEKKHYVYDPKEGKWDVAANALVNDQRRRCHIDVLYSCSTQGCFWYDRESKEWRKVRRLEAFDTNVRDGVIIALANYCGKLLILWDKIEKPRRGQCRNKNIWCSGINLERRNGDEDEVWGTVEWASVVLTVPSSYVFLRYEVNSV